MKTQSKKHLSLVTDINPESGPRIVTGADAVELAEVFGLPIKQHGKHVEGKWERQPDLTPTDARVALDAKTVEASDIYCNVYPYRGYTIILEGEERRILDGDNDVVAYLAKSEDDRAAALFIDGLLRGRNEGEAIGRALARREISDVASLFLGPLVQPLADRLQSLEETLNTRLSSK